MPVSTSFSHLIILAVILLEKPVAGSTLELKLLQGIFIPFFASSDINFYRL
jgi:hypothetical protein